MRNTSGTLQPGADAVQRAAAVGLLVNILLALIKGYAGFATGSRALVADAFHTLTDLTTDIAVILGARYWCRPPDRTHPMGHRGIETAVTIFIGIMLIGAGFGLLYDSAASIGSSLPSRSPGPWALAVAALSIAAKETLFRWTGRRAKATGSPALAANAHHQRSDALSSLPVLVALALALVGPGLAFLDALAGAVVSVFVLSAGLRVLRPAFGEITNTAAPSNVVDRIRNTALSVNGVAGIHDLRARLQAGAVFVDLHVQMDGDITLKRGYFIAREVERSILLTEPSVKDVVARIEPIAPCGDPDGCPLSL
jgi:cation diffusion facilitator family transporter